LAKLTIN